MSAVLDRNSAAVRAFAVLDALAAADGPAALADIALQVGLPKPTVHRLLAQLESAGVVMREPQGKRFTVGTRLSRLALQVLANSTQRGARHATLRALVDDLGETCNLTMLDGDEVVYLDRVDTASQLRVSLQPGSRVPLHCSASGKLLAALLPAAQRARLLEHATLAPFTAKTITTREALEAELARARRDRVGTDDEEYITGLACVAVPVLNANGRAIAAIAMQAPVARMPLARALGHVPRLRAAAAALADTFE
ncbi:MAG: IclR family transcriptional regulator [Burkholderiales bacterium]